MARTRQNRIIQQPPKVLGFNPIGFYTSKPKTVCLNLEEYESIRLLDYENLSQEEASKYIGVSRPTLTRIYESARKKVSKALIEGCKIIIEGGSFIFKDEWFECKNCLCKFNNPVKAEINCCALCGSSDIVQLNQAKL